MRQTNRGCVCISKCQIRGPEKCSCPLSHTASKELSTDRIFAVAEKGTCCVCEGFVLERPRSV